MQACSPPKPTPPGGRLSRGRHAPLGFPDLKQYFSGGWSGQGYQLDHRHFETREDSLCDLIQLQIVFPTLSAEDQWLLVWLGIEGYSEHDIAGRLGISQQAVSLRWRRLGRRLRDT